MLYRGDGFLDMINNTYFAQQLKCFGASLKRQLHPTRKNDYFASVIE